MSIATFTLTPGRDTITGHEGIWPTEIFVDPAEEKRNLKYRIYHASADGSVYYSGQTQSIYQAMDACRGQNAYIYERSDTPGVYTL